MSPFFTVFLKGERPLVIVLTFLPISPTHLPDLLTPPDNLPQPTDKLPETTTSLSTQTKVKAENRDWDVFYKLM